MISVSRFKCTPHVLFPMFLAASACSSHDIGRQPNENIEAVYNRETNRLEQLLYDSKGNGKTDKWSYMDGTRVLRVESDDDENGVIDRWEYLRSRSETGQSWLFDLK